MKKQYFTIFGLLIVPILFSNCNNSKEQNTSKNIVSSNPLADYSKAFNDTAGSIKFIKTKDLNASCSLCKDAVLYISPMQDKIHLKCFVTKKYTVMTKSNEEGNGEYIYIFKTKQPETASINLSEKDTLFTIKDDDSNFFYGIYGKYVFIDNGTGAQNRSVKVYNVETKKKFIDENYFDGNIEFDGSNLFFWNRTAIKKDSVCPEPQKWEASGNSTIVVEKIKMNVETLKREGTKKYDCRAEE